MTDDKTENKTSEEEVCPKCGAALSPMEETPTGKRLRRCSKGSWNAEEKKVEGCPYVKWLETPPEELDEKCPKCGSALIMQTTRFGKKMKKCSTNTWDPKTKTASGCDFIEWINGTKEDLDEDCPDCGEKLILFTTNKGKRMKKCSTSGWDAKARKATGCTYIEWLPASYGKEATGEENLPPHPGNEPPHPADTAK